MLLFLIFGPIGALFAIMNMMANGRNKRVLREMRQQMKFTNPTAYRALRKSEHRRQLIAGLVVAVVFVIGVCVLASVANSQ
jgi:hypothetical protein